MGDGMRACLACGDAYPHSRHDITACASLRTCTAAARAFPLPARVENETARLSAPVLLLTRIFACCSLSVAAAHTTALRAPRLCTTFAASSTAPLPHSLRFALSKVDGCCTHRARAAFLSRRACRVYEPRTRCRAHFRARRAAAPALSPRVMPLRC